jgi:TATA-box binding protein (TBP) (component of TFIID and TFIIIB)
MADSLKFPEFDDIPVSTKTFVAATNLSLDLAGLFDYITTVPYTVIPKKRGRKKKEPLPDPNKNIKPGSIISLDYEGKIKGVCLKKKKKKINTDGSVSNKFFRNSMSVDIILDKRVNFKICKNGTFQLTGCKTRKNAEQCVNKMWNIIRTNSRLYDFKYDTDFSVMYIPSMRNIDFSLGFNVDREKLRYYLLTEQNTKCILEPSFGYTGLNVKFPLKENILEMPIVKKTWKNKSWVMEMVTYQDYINTLPPKEAKNKLAKKRFHTFLVFQSGKVIMSGLTFNYKKPIYYEFLDIIRNGYDKIEERLDPVQDIVLDKDTVSDKEYIIYI